MQESKFYKKLISVAILILVIGLGLFAWNNKWEIHDRWTSKAYVATRDSSEVLANLNLTSHGELVYKASRTEVDDKGNFRTRCPVDRYEEASVLGCYYAQRIYILKVDEPKLAGVEEVTAAHELLHAQFERMSLSKKVEVEDLLANWRRSVQDEDTNQLVEEYKKNLGESEDLNNEIFAIYGTQLEEVSPELEKIYQEYFKDRASIVARYKQYSSEFKELEDRVNTYDAKLAKLKSEKEDLEQEITKLGNELSAQKRELEVLNNSDSAEEYQRAAVAYNVQVGVYNKKVLRIRAVVDEYNNIVEQRNSEALYAKSLSDKLNANVEER